MLTTHPAVKGPSRQRAARRSARPAGSSSNSFCAADEEKRQIGVSVRREVEQEPQGVEGGDSRSGGRRRRRGAGVVRSCAISRKLVAQMTEGEMATNGEAASRLAEFLAEVGHQLGGREGRKGQVNRYRAARLPAGEQAGSCPSRAGRRERPGPGHGTSA